MMAISTCDLGLINAGLLADILALWNIRDILFVFVKSAAYVTENPNPTPARWTLQTTVEGLATSINVIRKHTIKPASNMKLNSRPLAFTTGVSMNLIKVIPTAIVNNIPNADKHTGIITNKLVHSMY